jgi:hypothetical protein
VKKQNFGMGIMRTSSPEPKSAFGMPTTLSASPVLKKKFDFRYKEPLFLPDFEDNSDMQVPVSPLLHAEDFSTLPISNEGPSETGTHQPTEAKEPLSSSSKGRGKFHITTSYTHLTLAYTAWIWGERAPSPTDNKQEGQPSMIGQVDLMHELVCWAIHMLA